MKKLRDSSVNVVCFCFYHYFLLSHKKFADNFPKIGKVIVSNWYQNLNDELIRECAKSVLQSLDSRLTHHRC